MHYLYKHPPFHLPLTHPLISLSFHLNTARSWNKPFTNGNRRNRKTFKEIIKNPDVA